VILDAVVVWPAELCARYAKALEAMVRAQCRRDGCPVDDALSELLYEMSEVADRYRAAHAPAAVGGSNGSGPAGSSVTVTEMTTNDVAELLNITPRGVRDLRARGRLPGHRAATGAAWMFDALDVAAYQKGREQ